MGERPEHAPRVLHVLAGDVGGTKTLLAICRVENGEITVVRETRLESGAFPSLGRLVVSFLGGSGERIDRACFAVAGPVVEGTVHAVNLSWDIVLHELAGEIGVEDTILINDFRAIGFGLPFLRGEDLRTLQDRDPIPGGAIGMIGAGTGLGEAYLVWESGRCYCYASEGGHCSFSPNDERQDRLLGWLRRQFDHVSFERVLSGPGLVNVYRFLVESEGRQELDSTRARMLEEDPAAVVSGLALLDEDPVCAEALDLFSTLYGIEAGNLALKVLATGGIYVAGGIAPRILPKLTDGSFLRGFRFKGRHSDLMQSIPVHVITNPKVGLRGAAAHAGGLI